MLVAVHVALFVVLLAQGGPVRGDFDRFWQIGAASSRPYRDFPVEYPPVTVAIFRTLAAVGTPERFGYGLLVLNLAADALLIAALFSGWGAAAAAFYMAAIVPMLPVMYFRFDLWPMAAATFAVYSWRRGWSVISGTAFAAGFGLKLWPVLLGFWVIGEQDRHSRRTLLAVLAAGCATIILIWIALVGGLQGLVQVLTFRSATGWSIESVVGSIVHLTDSATVRVESGAWRVGTLSPLASMGLFAVAVPLSLIALHRGVVTHRLGTSWIAAIGCLLLGSALISPQFFAWLLPGAAIAWAERDRTAALAALVPLVLSTALLAIYGDLVKGSWYAEWLVIVRNLTCLVAVAVAARPLLASKGYTGSLARG